MECLVTGDVSKLLTVRGAAIPPSTYHENSSNIDSMDGKKEKVVLLGASDNPQRYAHKAFLLLKKFGHSVFPVHPSLPEIEGVKCYKTLLEMKEALSFAVDTLTIYVRPAISESLQDDILKLGMKRVIFNPGTENQKLIQLLQESGVEVVVGCTLVMLSTNQF